MQVKQTSGKAFERRVVFGKEKNLIALPDLVEVQRNSYQWFFQADREPDMRASQGLQELFDEIFPIESYDGSFALEFVRYYVDPVPISLDEARSRDLTWSRPLRATIRLINKKTGEIKEEEIYLGDFPAMTERGTFIINGTERVVVNQLARSAGVYYSADLGIPGQETFVAKLIPDRGAWIEYDLAPGDVLSVKIDNRKKIPVTMMLRAFGIQSTDEIISLFDGKEVEKDLVDDDVRGMLLAEDILSNDGSGTVEIRKNTRLTKEHMEVLWNHGRTKVWVWDIDPALAVTIERDNTDTPDAAMLELFRKLRPNEPARMENAREYITSIFFDPRRYNLGRVGRYKINRRLQLDIPNTERLLTVTDIVAIIKGLIRLRDGSEHMDDIDHLGNRRVRAVGELLQNQVRIGLLRMERIARERMTTTPDLATAMAKDLINVRPISAALREFFGSGQLSQFMDQTNPLAELTHRRRLSALGPGGLSRERAGFEARDVHHTHYGRVCPIETPEGPNIGLVTSLATFARINEYGFLVCPRRKVVDGKVTEEIVYLSADDEDEYYVGRADLPMDDEGNVLPSLTGGIYVRHHDNTIEIDPKELDYLDISPKQIVSISTALIPFLEHDDANRALMGSNMQRQAVPLVFPDSPIVGTGIEHRIAKDSGSCVVSRRAGTVTYVDADLIVIRTDDGGQDEYHMPKFRRSNQGTVIHQRPLVYTGQHVDANEIIGDGQACDQGELALGRNVVVAFVSWEGYNFEDAILLSQKLVKEDFYTSIHIEEYEVESRDTKLGPEEISRDIPNVGEDALKNLDEDGIVRVGAEVKAGDILVGKVTPKGESDQSPEEKLLRAIFGEKAREVRDTSLRVPHGEGGKVVEIKRLSREKNSEDLSPGVNEVVKVYVAQFRKITEGDKMAGRHGNKGVVSRIMAEEDMPYLSDGTPVDVVLNPLGVPSRMNLGQVLETMLGFVAMQRGYKVVTPVFESATAEDIAPDVKWIQQNKYPEMRDDCKITIYDGRTGEPMANQVMVGVMYMLKLIHLVDDKIHARSIGPYSLITQQPLGGKTQFGGQRFGEMEVWALEGYGAAHMLQEMLTVKSDDIRGRLKTYERIVKGENLAKPGVPESFRVLIKELQGLALDVEIMYADGSFGELVLNDDDDERGPRHVSFKPDATVDDLDAVFSPEVDAPAKAAGSNDLFNESAVEYSGLELHETDEERDAAILSDDLFESDPQTGEQGDED
ncbi:DNA-directed RNA polymerase subunit beta [Cloacibacillus porcorum]|uniref:DNA-directed RNA polymerase subunit beta n=1 Tax=Cloacibacillus porcorum TaxID=1197717 RepID=UPI0023559861|nr:DNA-directed RNA polymerase subunit beta [Cloacibacillus porcorum]MCI5865578.1 DNA-directed RNA polymerase subunit beta [Cloacibacillus porcorum]MDD7650906.1 DNA-directed RNA polymerase subunit beta [Cloacibacillus porcorum]MDY4092928.1 DNA-directed RNA polymerase subunit beta [Cloacibacillus porcorum]